MSTKEVEVFIGPCSKYITGQGWTTEIPVEQLKAKGYTKNGNTERLTEENRLLRDANETIKQKAAEHKKQVDELKNRFENKAHCNMSENCSMVNQAVKNTAKEIISWLEDVDKRGMTVPFNAVLRRLKERYGVEVE